MPFRAIYIDKTPGGPSSAVLRDVEDALLQPTAERSVLIDVAYSTINYKDALAIVHGGPVVRAFPMIPGIDLAGTVRRGGGEWTIGTDVVVNGWGLGETVWGGLAERATVRPEWAIARPPTLTTFETMAIGTAGYTAALAIMAIEAHGVSPSDGPVLVTGATGGVGSVATMLLAAAGFEVAASSGKADAAAYLHALGAAEIIDRRVLSDPGPPLQSERWAAVIDSLGSHTLANACAATRAGGIVTACGLAQGMDFPATVAPFILRGVTLHGINSVTQPRAARETAWNRLAADLDRVQLAEMVDEVPLGEAIAAAERLLRGQVTGRVVVNTRT